MISLVWLGGEHPFELTIGDLRALQQHCDAGPQQILNRVATGTWRVDDLFQTIRLGLIGGGMDQTEANRLVEATFKAHKLLQFRPTAQAILVDALIGEPDDPVGEAKGETAPPENGGSPTSTEPEPS